MTTKEVLKEFWTDYEEVIRLRLFGWINGHSNKIKAAQKKLKSDWVPLKETRVIKTRGNSYRCRVKARILKDNTSGFVSTTYLITNDFSTGRSTVYLLPCEENRKFLIKFDSHFFYRYRELVLNSDSMKFEEIVDKFMDSGFTFNVKTSDDWKDNNPNFQVKLHDGIYGIGLCDLDTNTFFIKTCVTDGMVSEWRRELGTEETHPLLVYKLHKTKPKQVEPEVTAVKEVPTEKTQKELEIEQAWKEYYGR